MVDGAFGVFSTSYRAESVNWKAALSFFCGCEQRFLLSSSSSHAVETKGAQPRKHCAFCYSLTLAIFLDLPW